MEACQRAFNFGSFLEWDRPILFFLTLIDCHSCHFQMLMCACFRYHNLSKYPSLNTKHEVIYLPLVKALWGAPSFNLPPLLLYSHLSPPRHFSPSTPTSSLPLVKIMIINCLFFRGFGGVVHSACWFYCPRFQEVLEVFKRIKMENWHQENESKERKSEEESIFRFGGRTVEIWPMHFWGP